MKACKKCYREFDDNENVDYDHARDLADIFISDIGDVDVEGLCTDCREELGIMNLMGFKS